MSVYKGDDVIAGTSVGFVRELAWSAKQQITSVPFTAPKDGMIIGACTTDGTGDRDYADYYLNGAIVGTTHHVLNNYCASANMSIPVKTGDVFTSTDGKWYLPFSALWFVPYEYSQVSDIVTVTPEYIRNQNILSDYETVTIGASSAAATTMQYDGFIIFDKGNLILSAVYVNNVVISTVNNVTNTSVATTVPVKKGDAVYITNQQVNDSIKARFYKLRDYSGR